jgi:hypothetical protein
MSNRFEDAQTKPTIETVLQRINALGDNLQGQLTSIHADVGTLKYEVGTLKSELGALTIELGSFRNEFQLFRGEMEIRIDRIEGMTNQTRAEMLNLRADFRE